MGLDRIIHLEPFIKIPVQYENKEHVIRTCGDHENNKSHDFCPICGKKIKTQKVNSKVMLWPDDLIGNDDFVHYIENEEMFLFSNLAADFQIETDENVFTTLTTGLIQDMIAEFTETHKENIRLLEAKIKSKVKVEFGFVYEVH